MFSKTITVILKIQLTKLSENFLEVVVMEIIF